MWLPTLVPALQQNHAKLRPTYSSVVYIGQLYYFETLVHKSPRALRSLYVNPLDLDLLWVEISKLL